MEEEVKNQWENCETKELSERIFLKDDENVSLSARNKFAKGFVDKDESELTVYEYQILTHLRTSKPNH